VAAGWLPAAVITRRTMNDKIPADEKTARGYLKAAEVTLE